MPNVRLIVSVESAFLASSSRLPVVSNKDSAGQPFWLSFSVTDSGYTKYLGQVLKFVAKNFSLA